MQQETPRWSSPWVFILAATGSAVGLGNIWKFPYITAENGGGAFVIVYLLCIFFVGMTTLAAEILIGRCGRENPVHCFVAIAKQEHFSNKWRIVGLLGMLTSFLLLSYYCIIAGIAGYYTLLSLSGSFNQQNLADIPSLYHNLQQSPGHLFIGSALFLALTAWPVSRGLHHGLETLIRIMVPFLFLILLFLVAYAFLTTESFYQAVDYLFVPRWDQFTTHGFLTALGHAFFTLSIATASMLIYGCYLEKSAPLFKTVFTIASLDTLSALLAGLAIFPLVFQHNLIAEEGPALLFKVLPLAFATIPFGNIIGALFFLLLLFAALGSSISMVEPIVAWLLQKSRLTRGQATLACIGSIWFVSLGSLLSFTVWQDLHLIGQLNFYQCIDKLVSLVLMPLGGLLLALFAGWKMSRNLLIEQCQTSPWLFNLWYFSVRYLVPIAVMLIVIASLP